VNKQMLKTGTSADDNTFLDELDRKIIVATQAGMPLTLQPYKTIAEEVDSDAGEVMVRMQKMLDTGVIRRIGVVPNHYKLGYTANAMSVWNVPDECINVLGQKIGELEFVSHCYHRPRHLPDWPYNLFAMVHGKDRQSVTEQVDVIASVLGENDKGHELLYSKRILKKTGLRIKSSTESGIN